MLACVTFSKDNKVLANLDLIYLIQLFASNAVLKFPILINDSVLPTFLSPNDGTPETLAGIGFPIVPAAPSAPATNTL